MKHGWLLAAGAVVLSACAGLGVGCGGGGEITTGGTGGNSTGSAGGDSGLPCEVDQVLNDSCRSCHGSPLIGGATVPLLTYGDLVAASPSQPGKKVVEVSIARMTDGTMPPKPATPATQAQIDALADWIASGLPMGTCGGADAGADPTFTTPSACESGQYAPNDEDLYFTDAARRDMMPGYACIDCHKTEFKAPKFTAAGTVFPTGHVPDLCKPATTVDLTQAQVVITDATNKVITLDVRASGNFFTQAAIAKPYTAKVVYMGKERVMSTPQTDGDCNACHTDAGTTTTPGAAPAPGRVALPWIP